jgi:hypothetical protein
LEESLKTGKICTKSSIAPTTELAMTESEIGALKECTKDVIFLRYLMEDLHQKQWKSDIQRQPTGYYSWNENDKR